MNHVTGKLIYFSTFIVVETLNKEKNDYHLAITYSFIGYFQFISD